MRILSYQKEQKKNEQFTLHDTSYNINTSSPTD